MSSDDETLLRHKVAEADKLGNCPDADAKAGYRLMRNAHGERPSFEWWMPKLLAVSCKVGDDAVVVKEEWNLPFLLMSAVAVLLALMYAMKGRRD